MKKLIIFDGTSLINDAYSSTFTKEMEYAEELYKKATNEDEKSEALSQRKIAYSTLLKSKNGTYINAVQEFLKMFLNILDKQNPSHVAVVWGAPRKTNYKRLEIYSDYKNDERKTDEPLKEQTKTIQNILNNIGVAQYRSEKYEALDIAGSIANKYKSQALVSIIARNTNSLQLAEISDIWLKTTKANKLAEKYNIDLSNSIDNFMIYDKKRVELIHELTPNQYVDYKALVGNPALGIPGVKKVGEKTALPLIKEFDNLENLYEILNKLKEKDLNNPKDKILSEYGKELRNLLGIRSNPIPTLIENEKDAFISKKLVKIKTDILLEEKTMDVKINKIVLFNEIKKIDLANFEKFDEEHVEEMKFSDAIKTYDFTILSPLSDSYVGCNLSYAQEASNSDESSIQLNIYDNCYNNSYDDLNEVECFDNKAEFSYSDYESDSIDEYDQYDEVDEDYRFNEAEILVDIKNSIEQESTFSVLETIVLTRYKCNHCKEEFIIQGKPPRFCSNCGVKNEATIDIPVIEKSSCSLESMKKTNESSIKSIKEIVDNL